MRDFAFHQEPRSSRPRGFGLLLLPLRRLLVRILRPVFRRLTALLEEMDDDQRRVAERQERMGQQVDALLNRGWDQAALLRRVATLEHQVEELMQRVVSQEASATTEPAEGPPSYFCPEPETPSTPERRGRPR